MKKKSKFARLKKRARELKNEKMLMPHWNSKEQRRTKIATDEWKRYCKRNDITGKLKYGLMVLAHPNWEERAEGLKALAEIGDKRAFNPVRFMLKDKNDEVVWDAIRALGKLGDKRAFTPLKNILESGKEDHRRRAAVSLGQLGDKRAVKPLLEALKREKERDFLASLCKALGSFPDKRSVEPLTRMSRKKEERVAVEAINSLRKLNNAGVSIKEAEPTLLRLTNSKDDRNISAIRLLGEMRSKKGFKLMISRFLQWPPEKQRAAINALYSYAFELVSGKNLAKLNYANTFLKGTSWVNFNGKLLISALALNPKLFKKLPLDQYDERHKMDYLRNLKSEMSERSFGEIFKIFKLDKVKL